MSGKPAGEGAADSPEFCRPGIPLLGALLFSIPGNRASPSCTESRETACRKFHAGRSLAARVARHNLAGTGSAEAAPSGRRPQRADVCVVGAGFAGLAAASGSSRPVSPWWCWRRASRVGGRSWSVNMKDGTFVDFGGQWVGSIAGALLRADQGDGRRDLSVAEFRQDAAARHPQHRRISPHRGGGRGHISRRRKLVNDGSNALDAIARTVDPEAPWPHPDAAAARLHHLCRMAAAERRERERAPVHRHRGRLGAEREPGGNLHAASRLADPRLRRLEGAVSAMRRRIASSAARRPSRAALPKSLERRSSSASRCARSNGTTRALSCTPIR